MNTVETSTATSGVSTFSKLVANNVTSVAVDASPGNALSIRAYNNSATIAYLKLYNAAQGSTTCGSGTPVLRELIPANTSGAGVVVILNGRRGARYFSTAISACVTTGIADIEHHRHPPHSTYLRGGLQVMQGCFFFWLIASPAFAQDVCSTPASPAHTQDAIIYDKTTMRVLMVVCPSSDAELTDAAFNPAGSAMMKLPHVPGQDLLQAAKTANSSLVTPADLAAQAQASRNAQVKMQVSVAPASVGPPPRAGLPVQ